MYKLLMKNRLMRNLILVLTYLLTFSQINGNSFFCPPDSAGINNVANSLYSPHDDMFFQISLKGKEQNDKKKGGYQINKIVLDAGHGGKDPGCSGGYSKEKEITLAIVKKAGAMIKARFPEMEVIYTRDKDVFVPLNERANIANKQKADLFISVHCNAVVNGAHIKGSETYVLGLHRQNSNLAVAKRENSAVVLEDDYSRNYSGFDPNSDEGNIFLSMVQNAYMEQSMQFAALVEKNMVKHTGRRSYGVKQAGFVVLWATAMPSILIETGYLTNADEEKLLSSAEGQDEFASIILDALVAYKSDAEGTESVLNDPVLVESEAKKDIPEPARPVSVKTETKAASVIKQAPARSSVPPSPTALVFKIQLSASANEINISTGPWVQLNQIEKAFENNMYKYMTGNFTDLAAAAAEKARLQPLGFNDAFIVAYQGKNRISLEEAKKMMHNP